MQHLQNEPRAGRYQKNGGQSLNPMIKLKLSAKDWNFTKLVSAIKSDSFSGIGFFGGHPWRYEWILVFGGVKRVDIGILCLC